MRRQLFFLVVVSSALCAAAGVAHAASYVQSGWWTTAPVASAPDAPADGLVVQAGTSADSPIAFAAVAFALSAGETPTSLRLAVASGSASTPGATLMLCPLIGSFTPAQGGAAGDGPRYDCASKVSAAPNGDGSTYTFEVDALAGGDSFAVAILPSAATDRVVLARPSVDALTSSANAAGGDTSASARAPEPSSGTFDSGTAPRVPFDAPATLTPIEPGPSATPRGPGGPNVLLAASPVAASPPRDGSSALPTLAVIGLAFLAAVLWLSAGSAVKSEQGEEQ